ncbi:MAG: single-stranded-DNA-specific exonuclease RecJ [Myxococcales bacterium]
MRWIHRGETTEGESAREASREEARALAGRLGIHPLAAEILRSRGYGDADRAQLFLHGALGDLPDPFRLHGMELAVARLTRAIVRRERVVAYGDYDVDGVTATAQLVAFLRAVGADVGFYVPHRLREGYGLNPEAVARLAAEGARLIVTLDCGVSAISEVEQAAALGVDVVIVDHHRPSPQLPRAVAILNPQQPDCTFPDRQLCAAGVTFFLLMALRKRLREQGFFEGRPEPNLKAQLDLAALGTVADVVPLLGSNRLLVRAGLLEIARGRRPGLRALCEVAGLPPGRAVTAGQLGFKLAPRLNAAGRMDGAGRAVELLLTESPEEAMRLSRELEEENRRRRDVEALILAEALGQAEERLAAADAPRGLVLAAPGWHPGVVGIVASRVAERTGRPALLLAVEGESARGSGRSVPGFDLHAALGECSHLLARFGGHRAAAGLALPSRQIPALRQAFELHANARLAEAQVGPRCFVDASVSCGDLDERLALDLERLAPFGAGNPEPVFAAFGLSAQARLLPAKETGAEPHLKVRLEGGGAPLEAIGFGMGGKADLCRGKVDAAFHLALDDWKGRRRVQLELRSLRAAEETFAGGFASRSPGP